MIVTISVESADGTGVVKFPVTVDAKGNLDVLWQSPIVLSPGFYAVKPYKPDGTPGKVGTFVIAP
jgi:hypothetical protein